MAGTAPDPAGRPSFRRILTKDVPAGLINAVISVPDGLASAALASVNPVYGLYTSVAAPLSGSLLVSSQLMQIATTSASALAAAQAISAYPAANRAEALFLLFVVIGLMLLIFGLLRLGRLARFVSHSVMTGFLSGVAVVLVLDQLAPLVGYSPEGSRQRPLLRHPGGRLRRPDRTERQRDTAGHPLARSPEPCPVEPAAAGLSPPPSPSLSQYRASAAEWPLSKGSRSIGRAATKPKGLHSPGPLLAKPYGFRSAARCGVPRSV